MGDRIVVINEGVVQQTDAPLILYNEPVNLFVAGFLGSPPMNFVNGTLKEESDSFVFSEMGEGTIKARLPAGERGRPGDFIGKQVILGIRPEDIELISFAKKGEGRSSSFPAIVDLVEPMGAETNIHLQTGAHTLVCRNQGALDHREAGRRSQFELNPNKAHLFDPISTKRIA